MFVLDSVVQMWHVIPTHTDTHMHVYLLKKIPTGAGRRVLRRQVLDAARPLGVAQGVGGLVGVGGGGGDAGDHALLMLVIVYRWFCLSSLVGGVEHGGVPTYTYTYTSPKNKYTNENWRRGKNAP